MIKQQKKPAKSFFSHFFWAYGSRGNARVFFLIHFPSLMDLKGKNQLPDFFWWFPFWHFAHCADNLQKNICHFFLGDRSWTKNWCKFWLWSFDFGILILGVWILEFWFWILEFWLWGFGSWSFDFGFWSFDFGSWSFDFGSWSFVFGSWSFDFGFWSFDFGG